MTAAAHAEGPALRTDPDTDARFRAARQVADAVLFEGYVLYPYRASAAKNQLRWQFGVLAPPSWASRGAEHASQRTECLMEPRAGAALTVELRFLHAQRRTVQRAVDGGAFEPVAALELPDRVIPCWDEGVEERVGVTVPVEELVAKGAELPFSLPAHQETETVLDAAGRTSGRLLRARERTDGVLRLSAAGIDGPYTALRLTAVVENTTAWPPGSAAADRDAALLRSLVSAHLLLGLSAGSFLSMADPPEWARSAAATCRNEHTWPVLCGDSGRSDVMLSSPIILEDHPRIAPESPGALYDATEIDEILTLRTAALTEHEKREARGTDPRAGDVIDLADSIPTEVLERLHGAVRSLREVTGPAPAPAPDTRTDQPWWDPAGDRSVDPRHDSVTVGRHTVRAGSRVRLRPGARRTDAQDLFLTGRTALVEAVLHDVDGAVHLAVTLDDDPGADLARAQGRFLYFQPDEIEPLEVA